MMRYFFCNSFCKSLKVNFAEDNSMSQCRKTTAFGLDSFEYIVQFSFDPKKYLDSLEMVNNITHLLSSKVWVRS